MVVKDLRTPINQTGETGKQYYSRWSSLFAGLSLLGSIVMESRSFTIGYIVGITFLLASMKSFRLNGYWKAFFVLMVAMLLIILSFGVKVDSSLGRLLIYKISWNILSDNYIYGVGWNKFALIYGRYQAAYFQDNHYTVKELLLADNTKHAFNDYLQIIIETGLCGGVFLVIVVLSVARLITRTCNRYRVLPPLIWSAIMQVIAVAVAALFTHVFERPFFQCLFFTSLVLIAFYDRVRLITSITLTLLVNVLLLWANFGFYTLNYHYYQQYKQTLELYAAGFTNKSLKSFYYLYPYLNRDPQFLMNFSNALVTHREYRRAIILLEKVNSIHTTSYVYQQLAFCYYKIGLQRRAEESYLMAIYIVPNRFSSRLELFNFYIQTAQPNKAIDVGKAILTLPIKVSSGNVNVIRETVAEKMNRL